MHHPIFHKSGKMHTTIFFWNSQDEIETLVGYLKTNEANGEKFVYLSFSGDFFGRSEIPNLIAVDLSGFSNGFAALQTACAAAR